MGDWHQAWGFRWRSPSDSINDPALERIDDAAAAGGAIGASQGQAQGGAWKDTGYGTQYQGASLDTASALRESRTGQSLPLQHTNVASARAVSSGTPWHEAQGAFAGQHAGQFWRSPSNSINDLHVEWSTSDPSGGASWQDSGLGFRYKSPSGQANDPNVVIDPYVPGGAKPTTLSPQEAEAVGAYMKSQEPRVTEADPNAPVPNVAEEGAPVQNAGPPASSNEDYAHKLLDALGVPKTNRTVKAILTWIAREGGPPNNPLNINNTDSNPTGGNDMWDVNAAAAGAAQWIIDNGYGHLVDKLREDDAIGFLNALQESSWASGHYYYTLPDTYRQMGGD